MIRQNSETPKNEALDALLKNEAEHYRNAQRKILDGYTSVLMNFYYHVALLHSDADKAAGIKKAMEENNIPVSEKTVKPKKDFTGTYFT